MRELNKLTPLKVSSLAEPGRYADGGGLYLQISKWGTKSWLFRFTLNGRARQMGLGSINTFSLKEARERALKQRQLLADCVDPIEARERGRKAELVSTARRMSFAEAAEKYVAARAPSWKNPKSREQWTNSLRNYAFPHIEELDVADVDLPEVLAVLEPIWNERTETAVRIRGRMESVLDWATVRKLRTGPNPARWRGHLDKLLPERKKVAPIKHMKAMAYADIPAFMGLLRARDGVPARALEFLIITAMRSGEVRGARWSEIDLGASIWTIPAQRMKAGRMHRVPLSDRAAQILSSLPREVGAESDAYVFPGVRPGRPIGENAMLKLLREMKDDATVHGFRSSFRDWAAELTIYPHEVAEAAIAHSIENRVERAYRRGDLFEKRRLLMADWARYCDSLTTSDDTVVKFQRERT